MKKLLLASLMAFGLTTAPAFAAGLTVAATAGSSSSGSSVATSSSVVPPPICDVRQITPRLPGRHDLPIPEQSRCGAA
jgi:hypothetical protein